MNVRCRLQRFSDARCFAAWVVSFDEHSVTVEVQGLEGLDMGDRFLFQVSGFDACATFEAVLKKMAGKELSFRIASPIQARPQYEDARIRTDLEGLGRVGDDPFRVRVKDVSASGMGLLSERRLDRWQTISVVVKTACGAAKVEGQVRYCKELKDGDWPYRIGIHARE